MEEEENKEFVRNVVARVGVGSEERGCSSGVENKPLMLLFSSGMLQSRKARGGKGKKNSGGGETRDEGGGGGRGWRKNYVEKQVGIRWGKVRSRPA
jgi:hypothetical protein